MNTYGRGAYLYEPHVHTDEVSPCGKVPADEVIRIYVSAGYTGCIITDHYYARNLKPQNHPGGTRRNRQRREESWQRAMDWYLSGYRLAKEAGKRYDFDVFLGIELTPNETTADILIYGLTEDFLYSHPRLYELSLNELKALADKTDLLLVEAHPFRPTVTLIDPRFLHGAEVYNGNMRHDSQNLRAKEWARQNDLLMISGSDFHLPEDAARGGVCLSERPKNIKEFCEMVRSGADLIES